MDKNGLNIKKFILGVCIPHREVKDILFSLKSIGYSTIVQEYLNKSYAELDEEYQDVFNNRLSAGGEAKQNMDNNDGDNINEDNK